MKYISIILNLPIFSNKDLLDIYLKIQIFSFLYNRTSLQLNLYFNKLFINTEVFLHTDKYYCRLLDYYIITKKNIAVKINNILLVLFPDNCTSRLIRYKINIHLLEYLFKIKLNKSLAKVLKIEPEKLKTHKISFLNFIKRFFVFPLKYKKEIRMSAEEEIIITNALSIIMAILKDDDYSKDKYTSELRFLEEHKNSLFSF